MIQKIKKWLGLNSLVYFLKSLRIKEQYPKVTDIKINEVEI